MEEDLVCQECNGLGKVIDGAGKADVCEVCYGLGYVKGVYSPKPLSTGKVKLKRALIGTFGALGIFYAVFLFILIKYSLGPITTLIVLLVGHLIAVSFLVFYIIFQAVRDN